MSRKLLIATKNQGKMREIRDLFADLDLEILCLRDFPDLADVVEDGLTFRDNAAKKAQTIGLVTGLLVIGEDSGLEVDALEGRPGVYSARFAYLDQDTPPSSNAPDEANNARLLKELNDLPLEKRAARYRCAVALADGAKLVDVVEGSCEGIIAASPQGTNGFGYDPLFIIPAYQKTFGELAPSIKAKISHRAQAFRGMREVLRRVQL